MIKNDTSLELDEIERYLIQKGEKLKNIEDPTKDVERLKNLGDIVRELKSENKFGIIDIKLTNKDEDKKIIEYIKANKTKDTYAFSRNTISCATGIPIDHLPYTTLIKISGMEFILSRGKLWFTIPTMKEKILRLLTW